MLEVIYRIYEIPTQDKINELIEMWDNQKMYRDNDMLSRIEIAMDIMICESREHFKDLIRNIYPDIIFARPRKPVGSETYCIIIGEHAWEETKYKMFSRTEFTCDYCGKTVRGLITDPTKLDNGTIKYTLLGQEDKYANLNFCCYQCKNRFIEQEKATFTENDNMENSWITKDSFSTSITGYIYKITKKSTGEWYVGKTIYAPIFRWGQHLKTSRFKIENIVDYQFEVLEIVPKGINILDRESFYIQSLYQISSALCLNETNIKNINGLQIKI